MFKKETGPYCLANDDSGHWYVIPVSRTRDWNTWIGSENWEDGLVPSYAEEIGGSPSCVEFSDYEIR